MKQEDVVENAPPLYSCKSCGSHDIEVACDFVRVEHHERILQCGCGEHDVAAVHTYSTRTSSERRGRLGDDHEREWEEHEDGELSAQSDGGCVVSCQTCYEGADEYAWEISTHSDQTEVEDEEFFVRCGGCQRELEFGWSHPERGGRIWPADCTDFNPWKCWPEPRFVDSWREKGWLRPLSIKEAADRLGIAAEEVTRLINEGRLPKHPTEKELATDSWAVVEYQHQAKQVRD